MSVVIAWIFFGALLFKTGYGVTTEYFNATKGPAAFLRPGWRIAFRFPNIVQGLPASDKNSKQILPSPSETNEAVEQAVAAAVGMEPQILAPTDMPSDMMKFATETAIKALGAFPGNADMAEYLRMKFESRFPSTTAGNWQTCVGTNFASSIRKRSGSGFYAKFKTTFVLIFASP